MTVLHVPSVSQGKLASYCTHVDIDPCKVLLINRVLEAFTMESLGRAGVSHKLE